MNWLSPKNIESSRESQIAYLADMNGVSFEEAEQMFDHKDPMEELIEWGNFKTQKEAEEYLKEVARTDELEASREFDS